MGTPNTRTVRDIVLPQEKRVLDRSERADLLDARRELLRPSLRYSCAGDFANVLLFRSFRSPFTIAEYLKPHGEIESLPQFKTRGLFFVLHRGIFHIESPTRKVFGLTIDGDWVSINIEYKDRDLKNPEVPISVQYYALDTAQLVYALGDSFWDFWKRLSGSIQSWVLNRKNLLIDAERVEGKIAQEDALLSELVSQE